MKIIKKLKALFSKTINLFPWIFMLQKSKKVEHSCIRKMSPRLYIG